MTKAATGKKTVFGPDCAERIRIRAGKKHLMSYGVDKSYDLIHE